MRGGRFKLITAITATAALLLIPATASAHVDSKRCADWDLRERAELHIDVNWYAALDGYPGVREASCKAAKIVGDAYLKADGWHPATLRAAGKTWRRTDSDDHNGGDDCANGDENPFSEGYWSWKVTTYRARTKQGTYLVRLNYEWPIEDEETCSG